MRLPRDGLLRLLILLSFLLAVNIPARLSPIQVGGFALICLVLWITARISIKTILRRVAFIAPFFSVVLISIPFQAGTPVFSYNLGLFTLSVTREGLHAASLVGAKAGLSLVATVVLLGDVPFYEVIDGLRRLKLPRLLLTVLSFNFRFLDIAREEALRMERAWASRYYGKRKVAQIFTMGRVVGLLLLRGFDRSERVYSAMLARGYDGHIRCLNEATLGIRGILYIAITTVAIGGVFLADVLWNIYLK
jgi:cobalt/nickel transport system permease protein